MHCSRRIVVSFIGTVAVDALAIGCSNTSDTETGPATATAAPEPGAPAGGADSTHIPIPGGEYVVQGVILQKYNALGASASPLGWGHP